MELSSKHFSLSHEDDIRGICHPLFDATGISQFIFTRIYDDGSLFSLPSNATWHNHFYQQDYDKYFNKYPKVGLHFWAFNESLVDVYCDAKENFNIDNKFSIIERNNDYFEIANFATERNNTFINDFYINQTETLKRFIQYFKNQASGLIKKSETLENRIILNKQPELNSTQVPDTSFMQNRIRRYYLNHPEKKNLYLTKREMDCSKELLHGKTAVEIASTLNVSAKTVEHYIACVKEKIGAHTRSELISMLVNLKILDY